MGKITWDQARNHIDLLGTHAILFQSHPTIHPGHPLHQLHDLLPQPVRTQHLNIRSLLEDVLDQLPVLAIRHVELVTAVRQQGAHLLWMPTLSADPACAKRGELQSCYLSTRAIENTRRQDPVKAQALEEWANLFAQTYNILPMDAQTFRLWAKLMHRQSDTVYEDAMIAATAISNRLTVVTRNVGVFKRLDIDVLDPFKINQS